METLSEYRPSIDKKIKEIFIESLRKALKKVNKKKFSFIGIIGSVKEKNSHDIDIIIFPNAKAKIGEAIIEYAKLFNETEKILKREHERYYLATCQKFAMQEITYHIAATQEGAAGMIPVHSMFFANYRDFKRLSPKAFIKKAKENMITIYGDFKEIKNLPSLSQEKLEPYFFILDFEMSSRIKTFPKHLVRTSAEALFDYLRKKYSLGISEKVPHNVLQIQKEFTKLMHELDKRTYS